MTSFPFGQAGTAGGRKRRGYRRLPQHNLQSSCGQVLDLSAGGVRVISSKPLKGEVAITLYGPGVEQTLKARVVWCKKHGFRMHEVGLAFVAAGNTKSVVQWIAQWASQNMAG